MIEEILNQFRRMSRSSSREEHVTFMESYYDLAKKQIMKIKPIDKTPLFIMSDLLVETRRKVKHDFAY